MRAEHVDAVCRDWPLNYFGCLVSYLKPKLVVELGTGDGMTASQIMNTLPATSRLVTVNWPSPPSGDNPWRYLDTWRDDVRLTVLFGDTRDTAIVEAVPDGIDLLYMDAGTEHEYVQTRTEWEMYRPKLLNGAIVVVDDIDDNDMRDFWDPLPYNKTEITLYNHAAGLLVWRKTAIAGQGATAGSTNGTLMS